MHIPESQLAKLRAFGYTEVEARFLHIAAAHSGYFTVGQFLSFAEARYGKRNARFVEKLLTLGHASVQRYRRNGRVYHVDCREVYAAIGKDYLRCRRKHELRYIRTRLLGLDFILAHPEENYFETAEAKRRYFIEGCKIDPELFSTTDGSKHAITFADGFPLCIAYPAPEYDPVVTFTYIDPGHRSIDPYIAYLRRYRPLFRQLRGLQLFYVATKLGRHQEAGVLFSMLAQGEGLADFVRMFDVQKRWDNKQYHAVTDAELIFRNQAHKRFQGQAFETLRRLWWRNQLPNDFQPREEPFVPKQKILFRSMEAPGQEGIFGDTPKRWGDNSQVQRPSTSNETGVSPMEEAKSLHEG
ncbi:MAG: hypothetical protein WBX16_22425 [Candidatus Acidiferrales bacterium]